VQLGVDKARNITADGSQKIKNKKQVDVLLCHCFDQHTLIHASGIIKPLQVYSLKTINHKSKNSPKPSYISAGLHFTS
jgi:hypothetical protein